LPRLSATDMPITTVGFNIVLIEPEIPMNTGNIGRLSLASGSTLHLVKPFGFELDDKRLKRAGLDYWKHIDIRIHENLSDFFQRNKAAQMAFFSSRAERSFWDLRYKERMFLVFGRESDGLPKTLTDEHAAQTYHIPMFSDRVRSLNLANSVSTVVYEGIRQLRMH